MAESPSNTQLSSQYESVRQRIADACSNSGRSAQEIALLAVSKRHTVESIQEVYALGQRAFGENYVQEGVDKAQRLSELDIQWHFIGPLQSNKSKAVAEHFHWVHTIDREKIAKRLNDQRPKDIGKLNVLIQVNISDQNSKSGISLNEVPELARYIESLEQLQLRGLMCIPAPANETDLARDLANMNQAFLSLKTEYPHVDTLSMGMSQDLDLAIQNGSTLVRIGTAIFGQRIS